jgi:hypothetical protein
VKAAETVRDTEAEQERIDPGSTCPLGAEFCPAIAFATVFTVYNYREADLAY